MLAEAIASKAQRSALKSVMVDAMIMNVRWCLTGSGDASEEYKLSHGKVKERKSVAVILWCRARH
jgi:hypothetical protein